MGLVVVDQFRSNELSLVPGGYTVVVKKKNGQVLEYTNIKKPMAYIRTVMKNTDVETAYVKDQK